MESGAQEKIAAFDALFSDNPIQILKILVMNTSSPLKKELVVLIKFMELHYALSLSESQIHQGTALHNTSDTMNRKNMISEIRPFCTEPEKEMLDKIFSTLDNLEQAFDLLQMMETLNLSPEDIAGSSMSPDDFFNLFENIMSQ